MWNNIIWNILGYNVNHSIKELNNLKLLSKDLFWEHQRKKRDDILHHHYQNTSWYKNFIGSINEIEWSDIPIITKGDLQNFVAENNVRDQRNKHFYFANTSGSSGHPFSFWKDKSCHSFAWAKIQTSYSDLGILRNDKEARFIGHLKGSVRTQLIESMKDFLLNRIRLDIFDISEVSMMGYIDIFKEKKIGYIYGYTNVILEFSKFLIEKNFFPIKQICHSLKLCIVTAEMCHDEDRKIIEKAFGIPVFKEYGSSETSIIAIEDKQFNWGLSTDRLWIETLDDYNTPVRDGEKGRIIITDLYNVAFPFIRYDIGDIGIIETTEIYPYLKLTELLGRKSDIIYLPSGKVAPGLTFYYILRAILEKSHNIKEFIIVQKTINTFLFQIVAKRDLNQKEKRTIINETSRYLEPGLTIKYDLCNTIHKNYSGKIQHFFSEI